MQFLFVSVIPKHLMSVTFSRIYYLCYVAMSSSVLFTRYEHTLSCPSIYFCTNPLTGD